jgi:hypothetical protein
MNDLQIDDAVLAVTKPSWKKVALVIVETDDKLGKNFPDTDGGHQLVAGRIEALVHDGRLEARGNTKDWRFGEVRRPNQDTTKYAVRIERGYAGCILKGYEMAY